MKNLNKLLENKFLIKKNINNKDNVTVKEFIVWYNDESKWEHQDFELEEQELDHFCNAAFKENFDGDNKAFKKFILKNLDYQIKNATLSEVKIKYVIGFEVEKVTIKIVNSKDFVKFPGKTIFASTDYKYTKY